MPAIFSEQQKEKLREQLLITGLNYSSNSAIVR